MTWGERSITARAAKHSAQRLRGRDAIAGLRRRVGLVHQDTQFLENPKFPAFGTGGELKHVFSADQHR